jgi:trehalose-6-phosphate synthase
MGEDERRRRLGAIQAQVGEHDIAAWIDAQLADLDAVEHRSGTRLPV